MGPSRNGVKGRLAGKTSWDAAHRDLVERHHIIHVLLIILLIFVLLALAAYLFLDIARHSSLPPTGNGAPQGPFSNGCSFGIPHNEGLSNATNPPEMSSSPNETASNEMISSLNGTTSQGAMPALNCSVPQELTAPLNSTLSKEMIPPPKTVTAPNVSIKSALPLTLQNYASSLAARASSITDATVQVWRSLGSDGTRSKISGSAKDLQEYLWQWPSSVNSWASPYLMPVLKFVRESMREVGDGVKGLPLPRANLSLKFPSINAH
jgi:hypothetical protein